MMNNVSRRTLLGAGFASAAAALLSKPLRADGSARFLNPIGAELYTVRDILPKEPEKTLKALSDIGYREVEGDYSTFMKFSSLMKQYSLEPVSCHIPTPLVTGDWSRWPNLTHVELDKVADDLKRIGTEYAVMAYIMPAERGDETYFKQLVEKMNTAGERFRKAGLTFAYHNHAFEFSGTRGHRTIDMFFNGLDAKYVNFEEDVFWVSIAGNDPVEFLARHKGRVPLLHLKDKKQGAPVQYTESVSHDTFQEVGSGSIDFAAVLRAAQVAGVQHYFVEQDQTPGDPVASLRKSFDYLRAVKLG